MESIRTTLFCVYRHDKEKNNEFLVHNNYNRKAI